MLWSREDDALASIKVMRDNIKISHLKAQELLSKHQEVRNEFLSKMKNIEQVHFKQSEKDVVKSKSIYLQTYEKNLWLDLTMSLIELNELQLAKIYIDRLELVADQRLFILYLMISQKQGRPYVEQHLKNLKLSPNKGQFIIRAKIMYRKEIGISNEEVEELALKLDRVESADEFYLKGMALSKKDFSKGVKLMKLAFERGHIEAGQHLFRLYTQSNKSLHEFDLQYLSNNMLPEAMLEVARNFMQEEKFAQGIIHYKLAIVLGSREALIELANMRYERDDYRGAIPLYEIIIHRKGRPALEFYEKLGICYYNNEKYPEALYMFEKGKTAVSYFYLGRMYENGLGTLQNLSKGLTCYKTASLSGHKQAKTAYNRLKSKIDRDKIRTQTSTTYSSSTNYSTKTTTTTSRSNDSWCFLTTATCLALGKGDTCEELQLIRYYRDNYLVLDQDGESLIYEYYQMAPKIIEKIEAEANSQLVYITLYNDYIKQVYDYLTRQQYIQAKQLYIQMVKDLYQKYELDDLAYEIRSRFL